MAATRWEDLRDASFRGVSFYLVDNEGTSGRRAIPRAYPKKEVGWTEDNGAVLTQQQINGKLIGKNYQSQLEALLRALNTPGPGELIHPWFGIQKVQIGKVNHRLSTEEGGIAYISFEVSEAGDRLFPAPAENTSLTVLSAADKVKAALANGDVFALLDGLGEMADTWMDDMENLVVGVLTLPSAITEWTDRLGRFRGLIELAVAKPAGFINDVLNLVSGVRETVTEPLWSMRVYDQLRNRWQGEQFSGSSSSPWTSPDSPTNTSDRATAAALHQLPKYMSVTPGSVTDGTYGFASSLPDVVPELTDAMQANITDFRQLIVVASLIGQAETIASTEFRSSEEAISTGDTLAEQLNEQAVYAVENGQRDLWHALRELRFAVVNDVRVRSAQLPQVRIVTLTTTSPVSLIAWRETGNTENRDAIATRNRLRDPAFILPGKPVEVTE
ncbi:MULTISPECIES: DNA circularization protein [Enterobacteriaceae]|uniref:DNA circularization protein n=1 Tax=Enterobacteriaceae TaxID=543 RepID=UPI00076B4CCD|nr:MULTISPECIES: DNA circularization N-terminal domain-containing protein [Enterobacteriaceae]AMH15335.1 multidrug DMT transporter [Citrobacter sp. FDAARGOS_156]MCU3821239.1 DNA circularization N-terminal domain-containing protein [Enterobacter roggenkampii]